MAKRERTSDEIVIDWASESVWSSLLKHDIKMRKMVIKGGLADWLIVLSVNIEDEMLVGFIGGPTLIGVLRKLNREILDQTISWRPDKYADQSLTD